MPTYNGELRPLSTDLSIYKKLGLEAQPVGVKFLYRKPEGYPQLEGKLAFCIMPEAVQSKGVFYADMSNFECAEPLCLGIANDDPFCASGQIGTKDGLEIFQEARANRRIYDVLPVLKPGTCHYLLFASLDRLDFEPDVLVLTGTARQMEIVLRSYAYSTGKPYESKTTNVIGCAWAFVYPFITGNLNYVVEGLCFGHIARKVSTPGLVTVSIPFDLLRLMTDNLREMNWEIPAYGDTREQYSERFQQVTHHCLVQDAAK